MLRIHTTLLLLLIFSFHLHAQKFITLYDNGAYQKSLDDCKKVIEKDKANLDAYLYKSLNLLQLALPSQTEKTNVYGIEASLSTLQFMQYKKGGDDYIKNHKSDYDLIMQSAFNEAEKLYANADLKLSERLLKDIFKIDSLPEYYYLYGKIKYAKGNNTAGLEDMNRAAQEIYSAVKQGKMAKPYLPELFIDLAKGIYTDADKQSAFIVFYRAVKLFELDTVTTAFLDLLAYEADSAYADPEEEPVFIAYVDSLQPYVKDKNLLQEMKWKFVGNYFSKAYYSDEIIHAKNIMHGYCCTDTLFFERTASLLTSEIIRQTTIDFIYGKDSVQTDTAAVSLQKELLICHGLKPSEYFNKGILAALDRKEYLTAAKLFFNYKPFISDKKVVAATQLSIVNSTKTFYASDSNYADCRNIAALLKDKGLYESLSGQSITIVEKLIAEKKFSEAGSIIRSNYAKYPKSEQWKYEYKKWVIADYNESYLGSDIDQLRFTKEYSPENCEPGKLSSETQKLFLQRLNYVRRLAGISDKCKLNDSLNAYAQSAALLMEANYSLSHMPPADWKCYTAKGANGAGHSNLSLGYNSVDALMGQMEDDGGNNGSAGHRRWILNPFNTVFGHGSTSSAMALYVFGTNGYDASVQKNKYVCWPPEGYCPSPFVCSRWSFSMDAAYFTNATVEVICRNKKLPLTILPVEVGYGLNTLVWEIKDLPYSFSEETTYLITVKNVTGYSDDTPRSYNYSITFLPVDKYVY